MDHAPNFIATGPVPLSVHEMLGRFGPIAVLGRDDEQTLLDAVPDAVGLIVRGGSLITRPIITAGRRLKVIARSGVGFDRVDLSAATERGIPVIFTPGAGARAVAEGALAMLLTLAKRLPLLDRATKAGDWAQRNSIVPADLRGSTVGIIGLGRIGKELAHLLRPFESRLLGYDPQLPAAEWHRLQIESTGLDDLLAASDYVSLHAPLTERTQGLLDRRRLSQIKPGAVLVNMARGGLIASLDDLYDCLVSGRLAAVGLDVFPEEPPDVSHPLFSHPHVLLSPHIAGFSAGAQQVVFGLMSDGIVAVLEGRSWPHVANADLLQAARGGRA